MKKIMRWLLLVSLVELAAVAAVIWRWMRTPYGRLHPLMAILLRIIARRNQERLQLGNLAEHRRLFNEVTPHVAVGQVHDRHISGPHGPIPLRIYTPAGPDPYPVILFCHGGGFALGSIASHDNVARSITRASGALVVSVDYRLAPEHPFPMGLDDVNAALQWTAAHSAEYGGNPAQLAVAGDSAGGNLVAATALRARDENGPDIGLQILIYPAVTMLPAETASHLRYTGLVLTEEDLLTLRSWYVPDEAAWEHPYASPLLAGNHKKLPPALIVTAEFDPLRDQGLAYAQTLRAAGVDVIYREMAGMLHGFLSFSDYLLRLPAVDTLLPAPQQVYAQMRQALVRVFEPDEKPASAEDHHPERMAFVTATPNGYAP